MDIVLKMFFYIIVYSVFGWILESIYKTILEKQFVNSGFLKGPFCPIYGIGAIIMLLTLNRLKDNILLLFLISFIMLSMWEYLVGIVLEKIFKTKYWDYSENRFNLQGRLCLKNSIYWGILGVLFIKYIHPFVEAQVNLIPNDILLYTTILIYIAMLLDGITVAITTIKFDETIQKINELGEKIKTEKLDKLIYDLKLQQTKLRISLYKTARRLKRAFPTMKSDIITNYLNEKIDFEALKKLIKNRGRIK